MKKKQRRTRKRVPRDSPGSKTPSSPEEVRQLSVEEVARILSEAIGKEITAAMVREDLAEGAPQNEDGSIDLLEYGAWLADEVHSRR